MVCTVRERESWKPEGEQDWDLLNPAEWEDAQQPSIALSAALRDQCRAVSAALSASEQQHRAVAVLRRVAQNLNDGPLLVYARELRGDAQERDLRDSLPPDRHDALGKLGAR